MNPSIHKLLVLVAVLIVCSGLWMISTPEPRAESKPESPAVGAKVTEEELGVVKLSDEASQRLGVRIGTIEVKPVRRVRVYGGEVTVPAGRTILVAAPLSGLLAAPPGGVPPAGSQVKAGNPIISLLPLLSPEATTTLAASRADVEGQLKNAQTQLGAMKLALDRAQRLFRDEAGSRRGVEEAQAQHDISARAVEAADARLKILTQALGDAATGRALPIPITAPESGTLRNLSALPGQNVPAGGAIFEIIDLAEVWVRVPVYVGDLAEIATGDSVEVGTLNVKPGDPTWPAKPVLAPPSANPLAATVDLFYALDNSGPRLTPGQRVSATLGLTASGEALYVPWSAVVHDIHGGAWLYEELRSRTYKRQRVTVRYAIAGDAVLAAGPPVGTRVVIEGAMELFGAETGFSK